MRCLWGEDQKCPQIGPLSWWRLQVLWCSSNFFYINFCNICSLRSNFQSVEHHLSSSKPYLLFLTETKLSETTDSSLYPVPSYFLYSHFYLKLAIVSTYDITCSRAHNLESSEFSTIWFRLNCHSTTKFFCAVYCSLNFSDYVKFFDYLTSKAEHILTNFPFVEISILGDFNVHHQLWFSFSFTDQPDEHAFNFAILHDLEQLVQHLTWLLTALVIRPTFLTFSLPLILPLTQLNYRFSAFSGPTKAEVLLVLYLG